METKVLHVLWDGSIGGASRAVYLLVQSQLKLSRFVPAIAFAWSEGYYYEESRKLGCEILDLNLINDRKVFRAWRIKDILKKYPIHHFHSPEITLMLASILCKDVTRVYTHRGGVLNYRTKKKVRHKVTGWYLRRYFHGLSGNTKHACVSGSILFGAASNLWRVTYNGLDFSLIRPRRPKTAVARELRLTLDNVITVGTTAHLRDWKRIDLLLRACAHLPRQSFRLLIIGDGPERQKLKDLAGELGLRECTIFTGMKEYVGDYLSLMDIFVLPSEAGESFGNAVVEAMFLGMPVIVFNDGGGLLEHVQDGLNGYVVSSSEELAARVKTLIDNETLRLKLGNNAKDFVTKSYTLEKMAYSYDSLYDFALAHKEKILKTDVNDTHRRGL